jgi:hypothetical protein
MHPIISLAHNPNRVFLTLTKPLTSKQQPYVQITMKPTNKYQTTKQLHLNYLEANSQLQTSPGSRNAPHAQETPPPRLTATNTRQQKLPRTNQTHQINITTSKEHKGTNKL